MKVHELENILSNTTETAEVRFFLGGQHLPTFVPGKQLVLRSAHDGLVSEQGILSDQPFHIDLIFEEL